MPRYRLAATVPAQTAVEDAVTQRIEVEEQVVTEGFLFVPPGSADEVKARLLFGETSLLPTESSDPTVLPGTTDPAVIDFRLPGTPNVIELRAWAPDADFQHTVFARFDTREPDRARSVSDLIDLFRGGGRQAPQTPEPRRETEG